MRWLASLTLLSGVLASSCCTAQSHWRPGSQTFGPLFSFVGDFPLGKSTNRIDYQSIDPLARRLYVAKMGAGELLVFDIVQNRLVAILDGFPKITGVLALPELHKVYASVPGAGLLPSLLVGLGMMGLSSGHGAVAVLDTTNLRERARVPGGVFPDGIAYDPLERKIFVSDELGSAVLVIDADKDRLVARIPTGGEVGNVRYDSATRKVYAPIQSRDELAIIDPRTATLVAHYALTGGRHPHGLAIAPHVPVGYIACDGNDLLLTVEMSTGKVLNHQKLAHDPDVLAVDPEAGRLYVAAESGSLSSFDISNAGEPRPLGDVFIGEEAHSIAVDPVQHRLYFPLADRGGQAVLRVLAPRS